MTTTKTLLAYVALLPRWQYYSHALPSGTIKNKYWRLFAVWCIVYQ
jgi:hypothetical protein